MPNVMAAQPNIGGTYLCESSVSSFLVLLHKVWLCTAAAWVPCSHNANTGECKTGTQSEFCSWQNAVRGQEPPQKCTHSVPGQETVKHRAKFGWPPVSDVAAVTKPTRETVEICWSVPKVANRSQPLLGRNSPYCGNAWRRYCCLTGYFSIVDTCLSCEDIAGQICAMVSRWWFLAIFCVMYFQSRAAHFRHAF